MRCFPGVPVLPTEYSDALSYQEEISKIWKYITSIKFPDGNEAVSQEINVDDFGAVGDGVTDDTNAFNQAIEKANNSGLPISMSYGKTYYIATPLKQLETSVDGHGATIIGGYSDSTENFIFNMKQQQSTMVVAASDILPNRTLNQNLYGKVFHVMSDVSIGNRGSFDYTKNAEQTIIADPSGYFTNATLGFTPVNTITAKNIRPVDATTKYIRNIKYVCGTKGGNRLMGLVNVSGDFYQINNISITGYLNSDDYIGAPIRLDKCTNSIVSNCYGTATAVSPHSGYVLNISGGSNNIIMNCDFSNNSFDSWGCIGCEFLTNTTFMQTISNRFDCHYMSFGYFNVFGCSCLYAKIPEGGYGSINIYHTNFIGSRYNAIETRAEMNLVFAGSINIVSCNINDPGTTKNHVILDLKLVSGVPITDNLYTAPLVVNINNVNCLGRLHRLVEILDYGYFSASNFAINISNMHWVPVSNVAPVGIKIADSSNMVIVNFNNVTITGAACKLFGETKRTFTRMNNCHIGVYVSVTTPTTVTASVVNSTIFGRGTLNIANLTVVGCFIVSAQTRDWHGVQEKFIGNIADSSSMTASWNT